MSEKKTTFSLEEVEKITRAACALPDIREALSEPIKTLRSTLCLTQKAFAEKYGIPQRTLEGWESGTRKPPLYVTNLLVEKIMEEINKEMGNELHKRTEKKEGGREYWINPADEIIITDAEKKEINYKDQSDEIQNQLNESISIFEEGCNTLTKIDKTLYEEKQDGGYTLRRRAYLIK